LTHGIYVVCGCIRCIINLTSLPKVIWERAASGHCKMENKKPPKPPFPVDYVDPHVMQQCLGPQHAFPQTAAPTIEALSPTYVHRKVLTGYNGAPQMRPKSTPSCAPIRKTCLIPGPVRPMMPNGSRIRSAVFPQCTGQTDRHGKV